MLKTRKFIFIFLFIFIFIFICKYCVTRFTGSSVLKAILNGLLGGIMKSLPLKTSWCQQFNQKASCCFNFLTWLHFEIVCGQRGKNSNILLSGKEKKNMTLFFSSIYALTTTFTLSRDAFENLSHFLFKTNNDKCCFHIYTFELRIQKFHTSLWLIVFLYFYFGRILNAGLVCVMKYIYTVCCYFY